MANKLRTQQRATLQMPSVKRKEGSMHSSRLSTAGRITVHRTDVSGRLFQFAKGNRRFYGTLR